MEKKNLNSVALWEILIPTQYGDTERPVRTKHHKNFDKYARSLSGGLTILTPAKGQWIDKRDGKLFKERVIPVRIACNYGDLKKIIKFTLSHYRQRAVMAYKISDEVLIVNAKEI